MDKTHFLALPRGARLYVSVIAAVGSLTVCHAVYDLIHHPIGWDWTILALLTLVSGSATVRLPGLPATFSVSETFVFTSVLLYGASVGTVIVALDALIISYWAYHRRGQSLYKSIFNVCALPLSIWIGAHIFFALAAVPALATAQQQVPIHVLIWPLVAFTCIYFALNSWIIAVAIALERQRSAFRIWREHFVWLSLNYFGGASVAVLLASYTNNLDLTYLVVIVPLLLVLYFTFSMSMGRVDDANRHLNQVNSLYMSTIETLAMAIDAKDQITHGHIRRVQAYAMGLADRMGVTDPATLKAIEAAALLHDMGKLAVPEYILNKPGPLTPAEFEKMKLHASVGADILSAIDFPYPVVPIVRHHHENWDGSGYPDKLSGSDIPLGARILSVVDCFDALTSDRPYRPRLSDSEALRILLERRGSMYDPLVVDTFTRVHTEIAPSIPSGGEKASIQKIAASRTMTSGANSQRLEEISGSTEEMLTLFDLARGLNAPMPWHETADVVASHLRRLVPASLYAFFFYDVASDELVVTHAAGEQSALVAELRIGNGERLSGWVAANRQTIRNSDPILDLGDSIRTIPQRPRSCLSTPLIVGQELVGVLSLYATGRNAFSEDHERIVQIVATQIAPLAKRGVESQRAQTVHSLVDPAAVPDHIQLKHLLTGHPGYLAAYGPLALLLISLEDASGPTDPRNQELSPRTMGTVLSVSRRLLRAEDLMFRYDKRRFLALLQRTAPSTASAVCRRLLDAVQHELDTVDSRIRVEVVAASSPDEGRNVEELTDAALHKLRKTNRGSRPESVH
jgi:putative nucleotidyltransferase with HDIG domain